MNTTSKNDLLPINTHVFYAFPLQDKGRREGKIVNYNQRYADRSLPPEKFPYIVQWDDGTRDIVGNHSLSLKPILNFHGRIL